MKTLKILSFELVSGFATPGFAAEVAWVSTQSTLPEIPISSVGIGRLLESRVTTARTHHHDFDTVRSGNISIRLTG